MELFAFPSRCILTDFVNRRSNLATLFLHNTTQQITMSDTEMVTTKADGTEGGSDAFADMPKADMDFIMTCIKNANNGVLVVS